MKRKLFIMLSLCLLLTGCEDDLFGTGVTDTNYVEPYSNNQGYILVNYDLKDVEAREDNLLNEFDFSGPMNNFFDGSSSSSVVIEQVTPEANPGINDELAYCATSGYVAPMLPNSSNGGVAITSHFGARWGINHNGLDIGCPTGHNIYAINNGTVASVGNNPKDPAGLHVIIEHEDDLLGNVSSIYMHNSKILVKKGDKVQKGQLIALSGNTGNSTGPHLHIGIRNSSNVYVDPYPLLNLEDFYDQTS